MAHQGTRQATIRKDVDLSTTADTVQLQSQRRFFSSQGNDRATREARALTDAFGSGVQLAGTLAVKRTKEGREEAVTSRGSGQDRDIENKNLGYNTAWDQLDAEADLNMAKQELPAYLESVDAESLSESALQIQITNYMKGMFEGMEPNSPYGLILAPGLLELEQEILVAHRNDIFESLQMENRSKILDNAGGRMDESLELARLEASAAGKNPDTAVSDWNTPSGIDGKTLYEYIGDATNIFFDGKDKRTVYWETIFDFAIRSGRVDIIDNVPATFRSGDPTGIDDTHFQKEIRTNRASAMAAAARMDKAAVAAQDDSLNSKALALVVAVNEGATPTSDMITQYAGMPGADATVTAALSKTLVTIMSNVDDLAANPSVVGNLTKLIYARSAGGSQRSISQAYLSGELGDGAAGVNQYQELLALAKQNDVIRRSGKNEEFDFYLKDIDARYAVQRGPLGQILNPIMAQYNRQAILEYRQAKVAGGDQFDASQEWEEVTERFDARRDRLAPEPQPLERPVENVTTDFLNNKATVHELQSTGLTGQMILEMDLTEVQKNKLLDGLETRF